MLLWQVTGYRDASHIINTHRYNGCSGKIEFFLHNSLQPQRVVIFVQPSAGEGEVANFREFLKKHYLINTLYLMGMARLGQTFAADRRDAMLFPSTILMAYKTLTIQKYDQQQSNIPQCFRLGKIYKRTYKCISRCKKKCA